MKKCKHRKKFLREDMELMFAEVVGIVWGLSHETNFNIKRFNNMANEIQNRYLGTTSYVQKTQEKSK